MGIPLPPPAGGRPAVAERGTPSMSVRAPSPVVSRRMSQSASAIRRAALSPASAIKTSGLRGTALFPERLRIGIRNSRLRPPGLDLVIDIRRGGEALILLGALSLAMKNLLKLREGNPTVVCLTFELIALVSITLIHPFINAIQPHILPITPASRSVDGRRLPSPAPTGLGDRILASVWMTDARDYRDCPDDGAVTALLFVPIIASTLLFLALETPLQRHSTGSPIPSYWRISRPATLPKSLFHPALGAFESLVRSRINLVQLCTLSSFILFCHMTASRWKKRQLRSAATKAEGFVEDWPPRGEGRRTWLYIRFSSLLCLLAFGLKLATAYVGLPLWSHLTLFETLLASFAFQFIIYVMVRLARRGFTLGELGLVSQGATAIFVESVHLTASRIWPITTGYINTYRSPTPLLVFQIALIPGAFLTGFFLSPLLVLSRNLAQKPSYRLRFPDQKLPLRKALAAGFYGGSALIVGGLIGIWVGWCLGPDMEREGVLASLLNPWIWVIRFLVDGRKPWSRMSILAYWFVLALLSLKGWSRQLARTRKSGRRIVGLTSGPTAYSSSTNPSNTSLNGPNGSLRHTSTPLDDIIQGQSPSASSAGFPSSPAAMSQSMNEFLDAADKRVPTLGLNARRKFFHALAVIMFVPAIAIDPAFCHLSFSAAFSLFIFVEYIRYFALYPFSAQVHLFMNEFIDDKDSGTAILSHFYLLTGCAAAIWLEGPSRLLEFTGVLVLGIGDAMASIVGKRFGRHQWTVGSPKTIEGSCAFTITIVAGALFLRLLGLVEIFSMPNYVFAVMISSILEALSFQNDNLTLPLYLWALLALLRVRN